MQYKWMVGILVAGGYGDGAWLRSVEFYNFKDGNYFNRRLQQAFQPVTEGERD